MYVRNKNFFFLENFFFLDNEIRNTLFKNTKANKTSD